MHMSGFEIVRLFVRTELDRLLVLGGGPFEVALGFVSSTLALVVARSLGGIRKQQQDRKQRHSTHFNASRKRAAPVQKPPKRKNQNSRRRANCMCRSLP